VAGSIRPGAPSLPWAAAWLASIRYRSLRNLGASGAVRRKQVPSGTMICLAKYVAALSASVPRLLAPCSARGLRASLKSSPRGRKDVLPQVRGIWGDKPGDGDGVGDEAGIVPMFAKLAEGEGPGAGLGVCIGAAISYRLSWMLHSNCTI
jgi:hypothetical protein